MSEALGGFLFGNVDNEGRLEEEDSNLLFDSEIRSNLQSLSSLSREIAADLFDSQGYVDDNAPALVKDANAVDYRDIDEVAEDETPLTANKAYTRSGTAILPSAPFQATLEEIKQRYPEFETNKILRFLELFTRRRVLRRVQPTTTNLQQKAVSSDASGYEVEEDTFVEFFNRSTSTKAHKSQTALDWTNGDDKNGDDRRPFKFVEDRQLLPLMLQEWENSIQWSDENVPSDSLKLTPHEYLSWAVETVPWEDNVVWNDADANDDQRVPIVIDLNDPNMLFETNNTAIEKLTAYVNGEVSEVRVSNLTPKTKQLPSEVLKPSTDVDLFNLSNDRYYEFSKKSERVRHGVGRLSLRHSLPALRLEYPLTKTFMSKWELRHFHRPQVVFSPRIPYQVEPPRIPNKKKLKKLRKMGAMTINSVKDISLREQSDFILFEYSEERPPLMMFPGMSTLIHNYYRKTNEKDTTVPDEKYGIPVVLENVDKSPFSIFGDVPPSQTMPVIFNSLFRAPLFPHTPPGNIFLVVKTRSQCYIHEVPAVFLVGQTFPLTEVPTPNSRKAHLYVKQRIECYIAREFAKKENVKKRLGVEEVYAAFPFLAQSNIRKKLRPLAEIKRRRADNAAFWYLRENAKIPTEDDLRKSLTPEMVCAYESMMASQQHLKDAGYRANQVTMEDNEDDDEEKVDDEVKLAPWRVTRNVINAFQEKGMLQLTGPGDPTGRGEGFSFIRVPTRIPAQSRVDATTSSIPRLQSVAGTDSDLRRMSVETARQILAGFGFSEQKLAEMTRWDLISSVRKVSSSTIQQGMDGDARYARQNRFSTAEHHKAYREDIVRIWNAQMASLSSTDDIEDNDEDDDLDLENYGKALEEGVEVEMESDSASKAATESESLMSPSTPATQQRKKVIKKLKIERYITLQQNGLRVLRTDYVTDPRVISAYMAERTRIDTKLAHGGHPGSLLTEAERKERRRLQEKLRRLNRQKDKEQNGELVDRPEPKKSRVSAFSGNTNLKCSACGQVGHIKTHKACPARLETLEKIRQMEAEKDSKLEKIAADSIHVEGRKLVIQPALIETLNEARQIKLRIPSDVVQQNLELEQKKKLARQAEKYGYGPDDFVTDFRTPAQIKRMRKSTEGEPGTPSADSPTSK